MSWPRRVKHRNKALASIYRKSASYPFYRVVYQVDGKRMMKSFAIYGGEDGAKQWADDKVQELAKGSKAAALTARQADDALAALKHLQSFYEDTGARVSLLEGIAAYCSAVRRLGAHTLGDAVGRFLNTEAVVQRTPLFVTITNGVCKLRDGKELPKLKPETKAELVLSRLDVLEVQDRTRLTSERTVLFLAASTTLSGTYKRVTGRLCRYQQPGNILMLSKSLARQNGFSMAIKLAIEGAVCISLTHYLRSHECSWLIQQEFCAR